MFDNIENIRFAVIAASIAVTAWLVIVQWSKFKQDADEDRDDDKFALIPYLLIPVIWGVVAVGIGLFVDNWAIAQGYIHTSDEAVGCAALLSLIAYMVLDYKIVALCGKAEALREMEAKAAKSAESVAKEQTIVIDGREYVLKND